MAGGLGGGIYVVDDVVTSWSAGLNWHGLVQAAISYVLGSNLENLTLTGSANINATGNTLNNTITGNSSLCPPSTVAQVPTSIAGGTWVTTPMLSMTRATR
ncbi:MAG: hypothetical protein U1E15_11035 [Hyphomicrobiales bacterium]